MQSSSAKTISILPEELVFVDTVVGTPYSKSLAIKNNISATIELTFKSSSADRTEVVPKTRTIAPYESASFDVKKGRKLQHLKDYIYIKSNYFDMKVPVHILPQERSESLEPRLRSSLSPPHISSRLPRPAAKEAELAVTSKSVESQLEEQSARSKTLQDELAKARVALDRRQSPSPSPRPKEERLGVVLEEEVSTPTLAMHKEPAEETAKPPMGEQDETLNKIRQILKDKHPSLEALMDVSLKQEREKHERQNEKVLQILKIKDGLIEELQQKLSDLESHQRTGEFSTEEVQKQMRDLLKENAALQTREQQLVQTVAEHEETIKLLNDNREQLLSQQKPVGEDLEKFNLELRQKLEAAADEASRCKGSLENLAKELAESQRKTAELKKREDYVLELANRQEEIKRKHEEQIKKKDELIEETHKEVERLQKAEESFRKEIARFKAADAEINKVREEKAELEAKMQEMEEFYRTDNEKLASIIQQFKGKEPGTKADRSFTIEDLRSTSKDYMGKLQEQIEQQQRKIEELSGKSQQLEARAKLSESMAATHQADKTAMITKYSEEINRQQKAILDLQSSHQKIVKNVEVQTALKGDNVSDLTRMIEEYKNKLDYSAQQREEREKYIAELESQLRKQSQDTERAKAELDSVVKHCDQTHSGISQLEQSEIVTKLNSRVSALQIQVHQLQSKLKEAEDELLRMKQENPAGISSSSAIPRAQPQTAVTEHMAERADALEVVIVQLREEIIQLEVEKRNSEQSLRLELDTKDAKIKALEGILNSGFAKDSSQLYAINTKAELEKSKEVSKMLEERVKSSEQELTGVLKELARLKQTERLSNVLPSDGEIAMKLTNKIKTQRGEIRHLQSLLKRAKIEFDRLSSAMQSRSAPEKSFCGKSDKGKDENPETALERARSEQKIAELTRRCEEYRRKLNDCLRVMLELKEEFSHKLIEKEDRHQRQLFKLAEECRQKGRDSALMSHKVGRLEEKLKETQISADSSRDLLTRTSGTLSEKIRQLEDSLNLGKRSQEETRVQVKKHEIVIQERSAQIAVLMETIETIQKNSKDATAQKYLNSNVELCSSRAMYAKLESRNVELEALLQDLKRGATENSQRESELRTENMRLKHEVSEARKLVEGQTKQIEKLEEFVEEGRTEVATGVARTHGLEEQVRVKERRLEMFKVQLGELQQSLRDGKRLVPAGSVKASKSPAPSLNTTLSKQWMGTEETKEGFRPGEGKQITVLLKQLLADIQKEFDQLTAEEKQTALFQRLTSVILRSDQVISDLEKANSELEQKLVATQIRGEERVAYEKVLMRCDVLAGENTELNLLLEKLLSCEEENKLEHIQKLEQTLLTAQQGLRTADLKLISAAEESCRLKAGLQEAHDKLEAKIKESQVAKVKLEKELALARIKAEEEMSLKLSIRNEEIKTYFDTHVSKLILGKEDASQILSLSREVCAQKLLVEKLQMQLTNSGKERSALELQTQELMTVLARNTAQLEELQFGECTKLKKKAEQYAEYGQGTLPRVELGKKLLKAELDRKSSELSELTALLHQYKEQNSKLKLAADKFCQKDCYYPSKSGKDPAVEDLENKMAMLNSALDEKDKGLEMLEKKLVEVSSEHALEIQNMQSDMELRLQDERKNLMMEFDSLAKRYKPGEAPGEIAAENEALKAQCLMLRQSIEKLESEQVILRQKVGSLGEDCVQYKNEAELYKKALAELQDVTSLGIEQTPMSTSRLKASLLTPAEKKCAGGKEGKKKAALLASAEKSAAKPEEILSAKAEAGAAKLPRFVKALMCAKFNEADAEAKVRRLARTELELRRDLTKSTQQVKDLESKLRHYERLLKDSNVRITSPSSESPLDEDVSWLKKRILELEATCEDMRLKELQGLTSYEGVMTDTGVQQSESLSDQNVTAVLVQGLVTLCAQLAATEAQLKERRAAPGADASSYPPATSGGENAGNVEKVQRIIIKTLTGMLRKAMGDAAWSSQCAVPTNEADRQVWYLELMEIQTQNVERAIAQLKEYTTKISVEITGSLASAAQVKAAALELANQTKEAAEEVYSLRNMCALAKRDLEDMAGISQARSAAGGKSGELAERLAFAEKMRKNLENEVAQLKIALSYHQTEGKQIVEGTRGEMDRVIKRSKDLEAELNSTAARRQELEKELIREKTANDELRLDLQANIRKLSDLTSLLEKYKGELKQGAKDSRKISEKEDTIRGLEAKHDVLAGQCDVLMKENKELKERIAAAEKSFGDTQNEAIKALQKENKELDAKLHSEIEERKSEIEFWIKERAQMRQLIDSLKFEKDAAKKAKLADPSSLASSSSAISGKGKKPSTKSEVAVMSDTETVPKKGGETKRRIKKYREKLKKMKAELDGKSVELFRLQGEVQDLKSRLHLADLNTDEERRKVVSLSSELRTIQMKMREPSSTSNNAADLPQVSRAQLEELQSSLEVTKEQIAKLERDVYEKAKREEELRQERDKMVIVIQELDREVKIKDGDLSSEKARLEAEAQKLRSEISMKEKAMEDLSGKHKQIAADLSKCDEELKVAKEQIGVLKVGNGRLGESHKELESVVISQEEVIAKMKQECAEREQEVKKEIETLRAEYKENKKSADDLVALYETQLRLLKERFKEEYVELSNKLTIQSQSKGAIMSPKKKEQVELSVDLMFQISQKDAQIKTLEKEAGKLRSKTKSSKAAIAKLQAQLKDVSALVASKSKSKSPGIGSSDLKRGKTVAVPVPVPDEAQMKAYNILLKEKTELELRLSKVQNGIKALEGKVQMEKERAEEAEMKIETQTKECEDLKEGLRNSKKELTETSKKHKAEMQKLLDELVQVKNAWKSPDELAKCQEEKKDLETQLKAAREELNRKKELMKQWKDKEELRQSETGQLMTEIGAAKDENEKLKKSVKELTRKDQTIKSLKTAMESGKGSEKQLAEDNKALVEKLKAMKAEIARKDTALKAFKEKSEEVRTDKENVKGKDSEIDKLKVRISTLKQDIDRKDEQIKALKAKVESLMQELDSTKTVLDSRSKTDQSQLEKGHEKMGKTKQKLRAAEAKIQKLSVMLRTLFRELLTEVEKLRARAGAYQKSMAMTKGDIEGKFYAESMNILGLGAEEIGEFVQAKAGEEDKKGNEDLVKLVERINRVVDNSELPEDYETVIEKHKQLMKEKVDLERIINAMEEKTGKPGSLEERYSVGHDNE